MHSTALCGLSSVSDLAGSNLSTQSNVVQLLGAAKSSELHGGESMHQDEHCWVQIVSKYSAVIYWMGSEDHPSLCLLEKVYLLLQLCFCLFSWSTSNSWHPCVGSNVQDMLPIKSTLSKRGPTLGVVVVRMRWTCWSTGNPMLQTAEIGEEIHDPLRPFVVHYEKIQINIRRGEAEAEQLMSGSRATYIRLPLEQELTVLAGRTKMNMQERHEWQ